MIEISTLTFLGKPIPQRFPGRKVSEKYWPYTSFTSANISISDKKIVVLTTYQIHKMPQAKQHLNSSYLMCFFGNIMITNSPDSGFIATCPDTNRKLPGNSLIIRPIGAGAFVVLIICFINFRFIEKHLYQAPLTIQ